MLILLGWVLVILGLIMVILGVLAWLGIVKPRKYRFGPWEVLAEIARRAPWVVIVGLLLIYIGLKILGAPLPF